LCSGAAIEDSNKAQALNANTWVIFLAMTTLSKKCPEIPGSEPAG
jgi:hypothetical protein